MKNLSFVLFLIVLVGCSSNLNKVEKSKDLMNTTFIITVYDNDQQKAEAAIQSAFDEISRIESLLSPTIETSEVNILNRNGQIENYSDDLFLNMQKSLYYSNISDGAFDITVQPILDLYTMAFSTLKRPPTDAEIKDEQKKVNYKNIEFSRDKIKLKQGMKITLGGIAKGYGVERAAEVLEQNGVTHALINTKSSIRAVGVKDDIDWSVALQNPRDPSEYVTLIRLDNNSISTSGDYERYFDDNFKFHHIVNPKTGYSAGELISVTIVTGNSFDADALSTAVFVLGRQKGMELIEKLGVKGLIITKDKEIIRSGGFD